MVIWFLWQMVWETVNFGAREITSISSHSTFNCILFEKWFYFLPYLVTRFLWVLDDVIFQLWMSWKKITILINYFPKILSLLSSLPIFEHKSIKVHSLIFLFFSKMFLVCINNVSILYPIPVIHVQMPLWFSSSWLFYFYFLSWKKVVGNANWETVAWS